MFGDCMHAYFWLVEHHKFIVRGYDHVENCIYIYTYWGYTPFRTIEYYIHIFCNVCHPLHEVWYIVSTTRYL